MWSSIFFWGKETLELKVQLSNPRFAADSAVVNGYLLHLFPCLEITYLWCDHWRVDINHEAKIPVATLFLHLKPQEQRVWVGVWWPQVTGAQSRVVEFAFFPLRPQRSHHLTAKHAEFCFGCCFGLSFVCCCCCLFCFGCVFWVDFFPGGRGGGDGQSDITCKRWFSTILLCANLSPVSATFIVVCVQIYPSIAALTLQSPSRTKNSGREVNFRIRCHQQKDQW